MNKIVIGQKYKVNKTKLLKYCETFHWFPSMMRDVEYMTYVTIRSKETSSGDQEYFDENGIELYHVHEYFYYIPADCFFTRRDKLERILR